MIKSDTTIEKTATTVDPIEASLINEEDKILAFSEILAGLKNTSEKTIVPILKKIESNTSVLKRSGKTVTADGEFIDIKPLHIVFDGFQYDWDMEFPLCSGQSLSQAPTYMAFGDGGHNPDGTPKTYDPNQTALQNELLRIAVVSVTIGNDSILCTGIVEKAALIGSRLSEVGLFDTDDNLLGFTNFTLTKIKASDETYAVRMTLTEE